MAQIAMPPPPPPAFAYALVDRPLASVKQVIEHRLNALICVNDTTFLPLEHHLPFHAPHETRR